MQSEQKDEGHGSYFNDAFQDPDEDEHFDINDFDDFFDNAGDSPAQPATQLQQLDTSTQNTSKGGVKSTSNSQPAASDQSGIEDKRTRTRERKRLTARQRCDAAFVNKDQDFAERSRRTHGQQHEVLKATCRYLGLSQSQVKALPQQDRLAAFERVRALGFVEPYDPKDHKLTTQVDPSRRGNASIRGPGRRQDSVYSGRRFSPLQYSPPPVTATTARTRDGAKPGERKPKPKHSTPSVSSAPRILIAPTPLLAPLSARKTPQHTITTKQCKPTSTQPSKPTLTPAPSSRKITTSFLRASNQISLPKKPITVFGPRTPRP